MTQGIRILMETYRDPTPENFRRLVEIMVFDSSFVTEELCRARSENALKNREHLANFPRRGSPDAIRSAMSPYELEERVKAYEGPSLFIHGRDDRVVQMEMTLRLVGMVKNAAAYIFNRCGHWCQIEHADAFNALVDSFLQANCVTPASGVLVNPHRPAKAAAWGG
jgi:2-hydroxy-6-oxonona-2,4-dienedioate hydrolase